MVVVAVVAMENVHNLSSVINNLSFSTMTFASETKRERLEREKEGKAMDRRESINGVR